MFVFIHLGGGAQRAKVVGVGQAAGRVLDLLVEVRRKKALGQVAVAAHVGGVHLRREMSILSIERSRSSAAACAAGVAWAPWMNCNLKSVLCCSHLLHEDVERRDLVADLEGVRRLLQLRATRSQGVQICIVTRSRPTYAAHAQAGMARLQCLVAHFVAHQVG